MMQAHRHWHIGLWLLLTPLLIAILWLALSLRPDAPVNDTLPPAISAPDAEPDHE